MKKMLSPLEKAIDVGKEHRETFDWPNALEALKKVEEEVSELKAEIVKADNNAKVYEEFSDVFFTLLQVARHLDIEPNKNLSFANEKYDLRFSAMLNDIEKEGHKLSDLPLKKLETFWQRAKENTAQDLKALLSKHLSEDT